MLNYHLKIGIVRLKLLSRPLNRSRNTFNYPVKICQRYLVYSFSYQSTVTKSLNCSVLLTVVSQVPVYDLHKQKYRMYFYVLGEKDMLLIGHE